MAKRKKAKKTKTKAKKVTRAKPKAKKKATKKKPVKKAARKKAPVKAKKAVTKVKAHTPGVLKIKAAAKPRTKSQIFSLLSEDTGHSRKEVSMFFDCLDKIIAADMSSRGPQIFTVPNLMKITCKRKPATKARKGVNPFTGLEMMFKAKPARNVVKIRPLKKLKEMV